MDSGFFQAKTGAILDNQYDAAFTVTNAVKDTNLVLQAVRDAVPVDLTRAALARWSLAADQGHGDKDMIASHLNLPNLSGHRLATGRNARPQRAS